MSRDRSWRPSVRFQPPDALVCYHAGASPAASRDPAPRVKQHYRVNGDGDSRLVRVVEGVV